MTDSLEPPIPGFSPAERLARAVIMFHDTKQWDVRRRAIWQALTGKHEPSTHSLSELAKEVLKPRRRPTQ